MKRFDTLNKLRLSQNASSSTTSDADSQVTTMISFLQGNFKHHFNQKLKELFIPHRLFEPDADHAFEYQQSLERCISPKTKITINQLPPLHAPMPITLQRAKDVYHLFTWIMQNIKPMYHIRNQMNKPKKKKKPQLQNMNELEQEALDVVLDTMLSGPNCESTKNILDTRTCKTSFGMAYLLVAMAHAAGIQDIHVVHGYLKSPKDILNNNNKVPINHAWCQIKIEEEYRIIDCWLASPYYPQNETKTNMTWFLTHPDNIKLTHLTNLESSASFFQSPYIRNTYFNYPIKLVQCQTKDDIYISFTCNRDVYYYAETESEQRGVITRGLVQHKKNIYTIKGVLPDPSGWLKLYVNDNEKYSLLMCFYINTTTTSSCFEYVRFNERYQREFYIQGPQCYLLYPLQTYYFSILSRTAGYYHKLAIQSPSGKLTKLMSSPQEQIYDGNVTITEVGAWTLLCIVNRKKTAIATWYCTS